MDMYHTEPARKIISIDERLDNPYSRKALQPTTDMRLAPALGGRYDDSLPSYREFSTGFREAYIHSTVADVLSERPQANTIDGIVKDVADRAGYSPRTIQRWERDSPYVKNVLDSLKLGSTIPLKDVERSSSFVEGLIDYKQIVEEYRGEDPFQKRIGQLANAEAADRFKQEDINRQIDGAPLQAQLYAAVADAIGVQPYRTAFEQARKEYLGLVAWQAGYDKSRIMQTLGLQSSTPVSRFFERAGLRDFKAMEHVFTMYHDKWRPKLTEETTPKVEKKPDDVKHFEEREMGAAKRLPLPTHLREAA
jgi:hypothetical protein